MGQLRFFMSKMYRIVQNDKGDVLVLVSSIIGIMCIAAIFALVAV